MNRNTTILLFAVLAAFATASAQDKMTLMPTWMPQAQFAGYYVALEKGFYADEGIDLTIEHMGVNSSKPGIERIGSGEVDVIISHPIQALMAREYGTKVKNVLQITQNTGMMIVSHQKLDGPQSLNGQTIGRWKSGFSEICELYCLANNLDVKWIPFLNGINLFISGAIDATVVMSYNEYYLLLEAIGDIPEENTIKFSGSGYDIPEDGVYVTEDYLKKYPDRVDRFCRATVKGWQYCIDHREESLDIVMQYVDRVGVRTNRFHQSLMLNEMINMLRTPLTGATDYSPIPRDKYDILVSMLLQTNYISEPVSYKDFVR